MRPELHTGWSVRLRLDKPWVSFVRVGLTLCTVPTTGYMADRKWEVQRRAPRDIRYDTNAKARPKSFLLWLRELVVTSLPCELRGPPWL